MAAFEGFDFDGSVGMPFGTINVSQDVKEARIQLVQLTKNVQESSVNFMGVETSSLDVNKAAQDTILDTAVRSMGLPLTKVVGVKEVRGLVFALEKIIIANGKYSQSPDRERHFRAIKELYKYMRGDPRVSQIYSADKATLQQYALNWLFNSGIENY